jgi:hypothetical protein
MLAPGEWGTVLVCAVDKQQAQVISTAERLMIDLAVEAAIKHQRVSAYLTTLPSLVDKRRHRVTTSGDRCAVARCQSRAGRARSA